MFKNLLKKIKGIFTIQTVPPDLSACEYDCREPLCTQAKFDTCEHRKSVKISDIYFDAIQDDEH